MSRVEVGTESFKMFHVFLYLFFTRFFTRRWRTEYQTDL